jgi:hypothetical protein
MIPPSGWNPAFSAQDKQEYANLFLYIQPIHGDIIANIMAQMIIFKKKYHLKYSEEQEKKIADVFKRPKSHKAITRSAEASILKQ